MGRPHTELSFPQSLNSEFLKKGFVILCILYLPPRRGRSKFQGLVPNPFVFEQLDMFKHLPPPSKFKIYNMIPCFMIYQIGFYAFMLHSENILFLVIADKLTFIKSKETSTT